MVSVVQARRHAYKEAKTPWLQVETLLKSKELLEKDIEEANEEEVLVELARIEACKEHRERVAQWEAKRKRFSQRIDEIKAQKMELEEKIERATRLETKLASTTADINDLLELNEKGKRHAKAGLRGIQDEMEASKEELATLKEESFQLMALMDAIREKKNCVKEEFKEVAITKEKEDVVIGKLNSELLKKKSELDAISASAHNAKKTVFNLTSARKGLQSKTEVARKEKMDTETGVLNLQIKKSNSEFNHLKERLLLTVQELEGVKGSEAAAVERLKAVSDKAMHSRASAKLDSTITISELEHDYLRKCSKAEELADMKVAAANAWTEAVTISEKVMLLLIKIAKRELHKIRDMEEKESNRVEKELAVEVGVQHKRQIHRD